MREWIDMIVREVLCMLETPNKLLIGHSYGLDGLPIDDLESEYLESFPIGDGDNDVNYIVRKSTYIYILVNHKTVHVRSETGDAFYPLFVSDFNITGSNWFQVTDELGSIGSIVDGKIYYGTIQQDYFVEGVPEDTDNQWGIISYDALVAPSIEESYAITSIPGISVATMSVDPAYASTGGGGKGVDIIKVANSYVIALFDGYFIVTDDILTTRSVVPTRFPLPDTEEIWRFPTRFIMTSAGWRIAYNTAQYDCNAEFTIFGPDGIVNEGLVYSSVSCLLAAPNDGVLMIADGDVYCSSSFGETFGAEQMWSNIEYDGGSCYADWLYTLSSGLVVSAVHRGVQSNDNLVLYSSTRSLAPQVPTTIQGEITAESDVDFEYPEYKADYYKLVASADIEVIIKVIGAAPSWVMLYDLRLTYVQGGDDTEDGGSQIVIALEDGETYYLMIELENDVGRYTLTTSSGELSKVVSPWVSLPKVTLSGSLTTESEHSRTDSRFPADYYEVIMPGDPDVYSSAYANIEMLSSGGYSSRISIFDSELTKLYSEVALRVGYPLQGGKTYYISAENDPVSTTPWDESPMEYLLSVTSLETAAASLTKIESPWAALPDVMTITITSYNMYVIGIPHSVQLECIGGIGPYTWVFPYGGTAYASLTPEGLLTVTTSWSSFSLLIRVTDSLGTICNGAFSGWATPG